jgi:hypothetical protein
LQITEKNIKTVDRSAFGTMTAEQKIDLVWSLKILHPKIAAIIKKIERCFLSHKRLGEPENLFITGMTGIGKTTLTKIFLNSHPKIPTSNDDKIPVLYARAPTPASIKNIASSLLDAIGDPCSDKGTTVSITKRLKSYIHKCEVKMLILDEAQHLSGTETKLYQAADWFKALMEDTNIPMVVIGLPDSIGILETNSQLNRRFSHRCTLSPFDWKDDQNDFRSLLYTIDFKLPFPENSNLAIADMPDRIFYASDGVVGNIIKLLRFAAQYSIEDGHKHIQRISLIKAYNLHIKSTMIAKENPFESQQFILNTQSNMVNGMNGRVRPSKPKEGLEILKT